jgi:hypothetical protein
MRSDIDRLQDILEAIEKIEQQVTKGKELFQRGEMLQVSARAP